MLQLLRSIFGSARQGSYPESLVIEAIERAVDGTDPWLRSVSGYRKKLRPAVLKAIDHVVMMVNSLAAPLPLTLAGYGDDPRLRNFFLSAKELQQFLSNDPALAGFLRTAMSSQAQVFALLAMEKEEKVSFGAALSGDVVIHDVPQVTVSFEYPRLIDPADAEKKNRRLLMRRGYDHLLSLALKRLTFVKSERKDLERRRTLLKAKLNLLEREGWGFDNADAAEKLSVAELEARLGQIETELQEFGGKDCESEACLQIVADLLGKPDEYLVGKSETIFVNRLGIKQNEAASDAPPLTFSELRNAEGRSLAVLLVSIPAEELAAL